MSTGELGATPYRDKKSHSGCHVGDLLAAIALVLIVEGIIPFLSPGALRQAMEHAAQLPDRTLRRFGLASMVAGVLLLYFVRPG
jgi:uncharacterized protein YjeT (DUF2065 family)